jgi:hypothetical protein
MRITRLLTFAAIALAVCLRLVAAADAGWDMRLRVTPAAIEMGTFYSGAEVRIEGVIRPGSKVAVVVRGDSHAEVFNRKIRVGPIWINSGKVKVTGVPSLFLRFTDGMLRYFLVREAMDHHQMDQAAIQRQMELTPDQDHETMVASWLSLKAHDGLYGLVRDGVRLGPPIPSGVPFRVAFQWPKKAPPAVYQVSVFECRDMSVVSTASAPLPVRRAGLPAQVAQMAQQRSLAYGILSILVASAFGFTIDWLVALVFGRKAATAH